MLHSDLMSRAVRARQSARGGAACAWLAAALGLALPHAAAACATCGCSLSTDAALGYSALPGWRLSLEYDYIDQDELRSGTRSVSGVPDGYELEHDTLNRYLTAGIAYSPDPDWNISVLLPYVMRSHSTYGTFDAEQPLPDLSSARVASLGDIRVIGSYQGLLSTNNLGIQLGVKLPTGHYGTAIDFASGPLAGTPLDASLQPGTGSTDLIIGAYYHAALSDNLEMFASSQFQSAVKHRMDQPGNDYRPGNSLTTSFGLRYEQLRRFMPQLQVNIVHKSPDQGALADVQSTAGTVAYVSPGVSTVVLRRLQLYGFVQLPVYSNLYGYQLFPHYTASVGASYGF